MIHRNRHHILDCSLLGNTSKFFSKFFKLKKKYWVCQLGVRYCYLVVKIQTWIGFVLGLVQCTNGEAESMVFLCSSTCNETINVVGIQTSTGNFVAFLFLSSVVPRMTLNCSANQLDRLTMWDWIKQSSLWQVKDFLLLPVKKCNYAMCFMQVCCRKVYMFISLSYFITWGNQTSSLAL